jgi:hypothetical protein
MFSYQYDSRPAAPRANGAPSFTDNMWVTVTWMPHSCLSQLSHVSLGVRSIHAILEDSLTGSAPGEWRVQVSVRGMDGLSLVPVTSSSTSSPILSRKEGDKGFSCSRDRRLHPSVSNATHDCVLDQVLQIPIRWRDLPRDAFLVIAVLGQGDTVVRQSFPRQLNPDHFFLDAASCW